MGGFKKKELGLLPLPFFELYAACCCVVLFQIKFARVRVSAFPSETTHAIRTHTYMCQSFFPFFLRDNDNGCSSFLPSFLPSLLRLNRDEQFDDIDYEEGMVLTVEVCHKRRFKEPLVPAVHNLDIASLHLVNLSPKDHTIEFSDGSSLDLTLVVDDGESLFGLSIGLAAKREKQDIPTIVTTCIDTITRGPRGKYRKYNNSITQSIPAMLKTLMELLRPLGTGRRIVVLSCRHFFLKKHSQYYADVHLPPPSCMAFNRP